MAKKHKTIALIVAGGRGERLNADLPKQYMQLGGKSILRHSIEAFLGNKAIDGVRVIIHPKDKELYKQATLGLKLLAPVIGGKTRQESVKNGLISLKNISPDYVLIHDAARPFINSNVIKNVISGLKNNKAVVPVIPVSDTVKKVKSGKILRTIERENLALAQTPQGFHYSDINKAHEKAAKNKKDFSDDAAVAEFSGITVKTVAGKKGNYKITDEEDMKRAKKELKYETRVGTGFDVHAFGLSSKNNLIMICGVPVKHERKLVGHSDADVGLHAIVDALLGAIGQGDIGLHFPPSDKKWKNADSAIFLKHAVKLVQEKGGIISNIDVTIICEEPKLVSYKNKMQKRVAEIAGIEQGKVNIKATTTEGLGFTGRKEGIAAQVVVSVMMVI